MVPLGKGLEEFPLEAASELELLGVEEAASEEEEEEGSEEAGSEGGFGGSLRTGGGQLRIHGAGHQGDCLNDCAPWRSISSGSITMTLPSWTAFSLERGFIVRKLLLDLGRAENIIRIAGGQSAELQFFRSWRSRLRLPPGELHEAH